MKYFQKIALLFCSLYFCILYVSCSTKDVDPITPTIEAFNIPTKKMGSAPFLITSPTSNSVGAFSYTSSNSSVATISGNTITVTGIGTSTITATQAANAGYSSGTISTVFSVTNLEPPTIGPFLVPARMSGSAPFQLIQPTSNSAGAFSYTSSNPAVATINGNIVTVVGAGTSLITANQAQFGIFAAGSVATSFVVTASIPPANIASDNFEAASGSALTASGWVAHSSATTNPILITSPGLTFANYYGSGIGNAASVTSTGQDVSLQFTPVTSGAVYASFLVRATASPLCIDQYFFALGNNDVNDSAYRGRLWINQEVGNPSKFKFGFAANATNKYSAGLYDYGTTYLVVIKYNIISATATNSNGNVGRDETSVYIFDAGANYLTEPAAPTIGVEDTSSADIIPGRAVLRQDNTNTPNVIIDGLRINSSWNIRN